MSNKRPRVAASGLNNDQFASIAPLCAAPRDASTLDDYLRRYSWTETDVIVSSVEALPDVDIGVSLMTFGPTFIQWEGWYRGVDGGQRKHSVMTNVGNTERELSIPPSCPDVYKPLSTELSRQLSGAAVPPAVLDITWPRRTPLILTTSGYTVASRLVLPKRPMAEDGKRSRPIVLLLLSTADPAGWFRAFLRDLHESDPDRVPHAPPLLIQHSDWYTPEERTLAGRISDIDSEIKGLRDERGRLSTKLAAEGERADKGVRRVLWADGDDLVAAASDMLSDVGFSVRDMDAELTAGEPKREDLRLTLQDRSKWQAMVEVKGYTSGTRTNDARQIREHRESYIKDEGRAPGLTIWLSNTYRAMDPSSRPVPDKNVKEAAQNIGAVHVLTSDLYRQWALVAAGTLDAETLIQSLVSAKPGLWTPPEPVSSP